MKSELPLITFAGYTNVGKSSLINALTKKSTLKTENRYFATLEPACRRVYLGKQTSALINDSVGFISELPEKLFDAFLSTIEEARYSDIVVVVLSPWQEEAEKEEKIIDAIFEKIGLNNIPIIGIRNKADLTEETEYPYVSAETGLNLEILREKLLSEVEKIKKSTGIIPHTFVKQT